MPNEYCNCGHRHNPVSASTSGASGASREDDDESFDAVTDKRQHAAALLPVSEHVRCHRGFPIRIRRIGKPNPCSRQRRTTRIDPDTGRRQAQAASTGSFGKVE